MSCRKNNTNEDLAKRLNKIEGQVRGINKMIGEDRGCMEILHQISSASSALRSVWEIVVAHHLQDCMNNCSEQEKHDVIEEIISKMKELR